MLIFENKPFRTRYLQVRLFWKITISYTLHLQLIISKITTPAGFYAFLERSGYKVYVGLRLHYIRCDYEERRKLHQSFPIRGR